MLQLGQGLQQRVGDGPAWQCRGMTGSTAQPPCSLPCISTPSDCLGPACSASQLCSLPNGPTPVARRGHSFLSLNQGLLDRYAECATAAEVIAAQQEHLDSMQAGAGPHRRLPAGMGGGSDDEEEEEEEGGSYLRRGMLPPSESEGEYSEDEAEAAGSRGGAAAGGSGGGYLDSSLLPPSGSSSEDEEEGGGEQQREQGQEQQQQQQGQEQQQQQPGSGAEEALQSLRLS